MALGSAPLGSKALGEGGSARLPLAAQTMFAELIQRAIDAEFDSRYDERGRFYKIRSRRFQYWYYRRRMDGVERNEYVGPVRDKDLTRRIKEFDRIKADFRERRTLVRSLLAARLPRPDPITAAVVEAMWKAGFFRLRGVMVGSSAFQCYAGLLGYRLPGAQLRTEDADFALDFEIAQKVEDTMPDFLEVLHTVDGTFRAIPHHSDRARVSRFVNDQNFKIDFLTPNRGSDENQAKPAKMPALGGAGAQPLRHLDFLIRDPVRSALLYKGGLPVTVPAPERYAVHKVLLSSERTQNMAKSRKDITQAETLISILRGTRPLELIEAWQEAWQRGPRWRTKMRAGFARLGERAQDCLRSAASEFAGDPGIAADDIGLGE